MLCWVTMNCVATKVEPGLTFLLKVFFCLFFGQRPVQRDLCCTARTKMRRMHFLQSVWTQPKETIWISKVICNFPRLQSSSISIWMDPILCVSAAPSHVLYNLFYLRNHFASCKRSLSSLICTCTPYLHANFVSSFFLPSFRLLPDCWAERSHHQIHQCRVIAWGNTGPIMAINNNGRVHLAWWLMGLSHSSFTWLLCGHQQLRFNVMLSKWAFERILYDSRVEPRWHLQPNTWTGNRQGMVFIVPLYDKCTDTQVHAQISCVC